MNIEFRCPETLDISEEVIKRIGGEVVRAATEHLESKNAKTALSHFTRDVVAVTNNRLLTSVEELTVIVRGYYDILKEINHALWNNMIIHILNKDSALVTAEFIYCFTDHENVRTDLKGIWTSLYVRQEDGWKIMLRHESFVEE